MTAARVMHDLSPLAVFHEKAAGAEAEAVTVCLATSFSLTSASTTCRCGPRRLPPPPPAPSLAYRRSLLRCVGRHHHCQPTLVPPLGLPPDIAALRPHPSTATYPHPHCTPQGRRCSSAQPPPASRLALGPSPPSPSARQRRYTLARSAHGVCAWTQLGGGADPPG